MFSRVLYTIQDVLAWSLSAYNEGVSWLFNIATCKLRDTIVVGEGPREGGRGGAEKFFDSNDYAHRTNFGRGFTGRGGGLSARNAS